MNNDINPNSEELKNNYVWTPAVPGQCPGAGYVLTSKKAFVEPPVGPDDMEWTQIESPEGGVSKQYVDGKVADEKNRAEEKEADLEVNKQDLLVSGTNIKTINGQSLLGTGNIEVGGGTGDVSWGNIKGSLNNQTDLKSKFDNIKTTTDAHQESIDTLESEVAKKANKTDIFDKSEINSKLSEKADTSSVYNKTEIDTKLSVINEEVDAHKDRLTGLDQAVSLQRTDIDDLKENKSKVTGVSTGDYWDSITIDGIKRDIPQGGGGGGIVPEVIHISVVGRNSSPHNGYWYLRRTEGSDVDYYLYTDNSGYVSMDLINMKIPSAIDSTISAIVKGGAPQRISLDTSVTIPAGLNYYKLGTVQKYENNAWGEVYSNKEDIRWYCKDAETGNFTGMYIWLNRNDGCLYLYNKGEAFSTKTSGIGHSLDLI